jgi:serine/threonine-protein kinase
VRFTVDLDSLALTSALAISPDGRTVVFSAEGPDGVRLYARRVDDLEARPIAGTDGAEQAFFSPDGEWLAFYARGAIRKAPLDGGAPVVVAELPSLREFAGGAWGDDDRIIYADYWNRTLHTVPARGGVPSRVAVLDTTLQLTDPYLLPAARAALVTVLRRGATSGSRVGILDLASGRVRQFAPGLVPYFAAGYVVYMTPTGDLYRQRFDVARLEPTGPAEPIAGGLTRTMNGPAFAASSSGALVYRGGDPRGGAENLRLTVTDRAGRELQVIPARVPWTPRFSPDGRRIAYGANAAGHDSSDLWITDASSRATQRLTLDANDSNDPQWSADGRTIVYSANAAAAKDLFVLTLDGTPARLLARRPGYQFPSDRLRDGAVLFTDVQLDGARAGNQDLWMQPADGGPARPYVATPANEIAPRASPDGRWVAYTSDETGRQEVYVQSYPTPGQKTLVSTQGGLHPVWRGDGAELYYWQGDQLVAVTLAAGGGPLTVRERTPLFRAPYPGGVTPMYDVSPDGSRFVLVVGHRRANRLVVALDALGATQHR